MSSGKISRISRMRTFGRRWLLRRSRWTTRFFLGLRPMKLLLDQGLPLRAAALLRESGIDAFHVSELGMACSADQGILDRASLEGRSVITLDSDFHALLATDRRAEPSVIRIRIEGLRAQECAALVKKVLVLCKEQLGRGCVVSVEPERVRVRRSPIIRESKG